MEGEFEAGAAEVGEDFAFFFCSFSTGEGVVGSTYGVGKAVGMIVWFGDCQEVVGCDAVDELVWVLGDGR